MNTITPDELKAKLAANDDIQLIDIREDYEFEDFNVGGINIPMDQVFESLDKINKSNPVYFICRTGKKSAAILHTLKRKLNLETGIYSVEGGITAFIEDTTA